MDLIFEKKIDFWSRMFLIYLQMDQKYRNYAGIKLMQLCRHKIDALIPAY